MVYSMVNDIFMNRHFIITFTHIVIGLDISMKMTMGY